MSDEKDKDRKQKTDGNFDIFILDSTYPEAEAVFTFRPKLLDELKGECLIVLDTNALLVPYSIGKESLKQIHKTYEALVASGRLVIPGQVSREFAKNRAGKLVDLYQQFNLKLNISRLQKDAYPLLESLEAYQETLRLEEQINQLRCQYKDATQKVLGHIRNWTWNDPVSLLYAGLFEKAIFDLQIDKEKVMAELARRQVHKIPPGYKDAGKEDSGIGDLLIWLTILEIGKNHKKSVVFVSGDEKADWWHKSAGQSLYPRYELVDEFRRHSEGQSFYIISFSQFLGIYGASASVVEEVRREETKVSLAQSVIGEFIGKWREFEQAMYNKCQSVDPDMETTAISFSPRLMVNMLWEGGAISDDFFQRTCETIPFRHRLVHGGAETPDRVREEITRLDELLSELK